MLYPPTGYDWPKPWEPIATEAECLEFPQIMGEVFGGHDAAPTLAAELQRECCPEHPLHGRACVAVARAADDPNEFVFVTDSPAFPIAFVHLTWGSSGRPRSLTPSGIGRGRSSAPRGSSSPPNPALQQTAPAYSFL